jgi:spore coat protein U-like protein
MTEGDVAMKKTMGRLIAGVVAVMAIGAFVAPGDAQAQTATANLSVTARVIQQCTIAAPNTLAFGDYDPVTANATANLDQSTTISVACTRGASGVWIGLGLGSNASASTRRMAAGGEYLTYELYRETGRTSVWGNTAGTGVTYTPTSRLPTNLTVFGRVPSGQDAAVGNYSDTVVATINF